MIDSHVTNAMHFIKEKYEALNKNEQRQIYFHALDATDKYSIQNVFVSIFDVIRHNNNLL